MPWTFRHFHAPAAAAAAGRIMLLLALSTTAFAQTSAPVYKGCYSSSEPMKNQGTYTYQTSGYCSGVCVGINQAALGLSNGNECWCGNELPAESAKVADSECNTPCDGYDTDECGGVNFWSVYTTGLQAEVPSYAAGRNTSTGSTVTSSAAGATPTTTVTTAAPSVVTKTEQGKTVTTISAAATSSSSALVTDSSSHKSSSSGSHSNTAGVAAGVVVAVVVVTGAIAALFLWLRYRKRHAAEEEEFKQHQVADFMQGGAGGERKAPSTSYSGTSDSRLEPAFLNRRNSHGSIADNEDYSRKILRVANPDRSSSFAPPDRSSAFPQPTLPRNL